jgi:tryptophan synthase alpha chain
MSRLSLVFERLRAEGRLGVSMFTTVGYPHKHDTPAIVEALVGAGTDFLELGMPFSDPLAEGRIIQGSSQRALRNGVTVAFCLEVVRECRERVDVPLILMGYVNPVLAYGLERFCRDAAAAGADGLILPDLSMEEGETFAQACRAAGLSLILFIAPTSTEERMRTVARLATGFVYCISVTGVTGSRDSLPGEVNGMLERIRALTDTPLALGFGISRPEHLEQLKGKVDAAIVGSALVEHITEEDPAGSAAAFVTQLKGGAAFGSQGNYGGYNRRFRLLGGDHRGHRRNAQAAHRGQRHPHRGHCRCLVHHDQGCELRVPRDRGPQAGLDRGAAALRARDGG